MATPVGAELQRLLDDREIERLLFEYCRCADANDPDGLARCFTENCVARYGPGPPSVGADARREQAERDLAMFSATSHHLSNVSIDHVEDGRARADSVFYAWHRLRGDHGIWELWGRYRDTLVKTPKGWRIAERTLVMVAEEGFPKQWEWLEFERRPARPTATAALTQPAEHPANTDTVITERVGPVLRITLHRPEARNAFNRDVADRVSAALDALEADDSLLVGILHGDGGVFSAGMDFKAFLRGELPADDHGLLGLVARRRAKPLIAAVDGYAIAAGFEVALACDLIVCARDAHLSLPEVTRGLVPAGGALRNLPRRVPLGVAAELALTGRPLDANRAHALGLVARLAEPGRSLEAALELAHEIAEHPRSAVLAIKAVLDRQGDWSGDEFWDEQEAIVAHVQTGPQAREGATAFLERRAPTWRAERDSDT